MEGDKVENYIIKIDGKKKYSCDLCDYLTERKYNMESHMNGKAHKIKFETKSNYETKSKSIPIPDIIKRKFKNCEDILKQIVEEKNQVYNIFQKIKYSEENIDLVGDRLLKLIEEEIIIKKALLIFAEYDDPIEDC